MVCYRQRDSLAKFDIYKLALYTVFLNHSFLMHPFSTPWKHYGFLFSGGKEKAALGTNGLNNLPINWSRSDIHVERSPIKTTLVCFTAMCVVSGKFKIICNTKPGVSSSLNENYKNQSKPSLVIYMIIREQTNNMFFSYFSS